MCFRSEMHRVTGVRIDIIATFDRQAGLERTHGLRESTGHLRDGRPR